MQKYMRYFQRSVGVCFLPFAVQFPSGIFVWIISTSFAAFCQNCFFRVPSVERFLELPLRAEQTKALADIREAIKSRSSDILPSDLAKASFSQKTANFNQNTATALNLAAATATVTSGQRVVLGAGRPELRR